MLSSKVVLMGTGGTIAGRSQAAGDNVGYRAGEVGVDALLSSLRASIPVLAGRAVEAVQVAQVDSKDMGPLIWSALLRCVRQRLNDPEVSAIVITHGTDTIEETAFLLELLLATTKPVVLTCAMRPSSALVPDGPQNLLDALCVAVDPMAHGVMVVAAGAVHSPRHVTKVHPYRLDAFSSGDEGPVACVEEGRVRWFGKLEEKGSYTLNCIDINASDFEFFTADNLPRVELVVSHAGVTGEGVDALLAPGTASRPVRGLVVAGTGNGTVHIELDAALQRAMAQGVVVWLCSRCVAGQVVLPNAPVHQVGGDPGDVRGMRVVPFSPVKARIALMLTLWAKLTSAG